MKKNKRSHSDKLDKLFRTMDKEVADSFTYKQRKALIKSFDVRDWRKHSIDFRPTLAIPFFPWSCYFVLLAGGNKREISRGERLIAFSMLLMFIFMFGLVVVGMFLVIIYLLKSWLGIDLFSHESLGIWDQFLSIVNE